MPSYPFKCPQCDESYEIQNYNMGFSGAWELRCDSCPNTLMVNLYHPPMDKLRNERHSKIEKALRPCECGGNYRFGAPHRCLKCHSVIELTEIAKQIHWPEKIKAGFGPNVALGKVLYNEKFDSWKC